MSNTPVRLKGKLDRFEVVLNDQREVVRVTANGQRVVCRQTQFGLICEPVGGGDTGGGQGPALQLRVTKKRVFARALPPGSGDRESAARSGFQRLSV